MASLDDQFEHGRLPLKPLPYKDRQLSQCNELMIDYGENASYHIYITSHNDPNTYIDITSLIIKEMLPKADINADQFIITIEGVKDPQSLRDIINFIYKRFTYADDPSGFIYERDKDKLFSPTTINVLLTTTDGQIELPITTADNVYDKNGDSIQSRLDNMTKIAFTVTYVYAEQNNQTSFEFEYPFENYPDMLEVRVGTTYVDKSRYSIVNHIDGENNFRAGTLTFINESIELGRRIDLVWIYNSASATNTELQFMSGSQIANSSIPICKLEKYSNSYVFPDSSSVATSKALSDLYLDLTNVINSNSQNMFVTMDTSDNTSYISTKFGENPRDGMVLEIGLKTKKTSSVKLNIYDSNMNLITYNIVTPDSKSLSKGFRANQVIKVLLSSNNKAILLAGSNEIHNNKYIHDCIDQEYEISFANLTYNTGDLIHVYRNGVRLFQDLDYSMNETKQTITLYVRTEEGERIVFESFGL